MGFPISSKLGPALMYTNCILDRYVPTIMRSRIQRFNILNIVLALFQVETLACRVISLS